MNQGVKAQIYTMRITAIFNNINQTITPTINPED